MLVKVPVIDPSEPDKSPGNARAIFDLLCIQDSKMYVNEKKQMQQLVIYLQQLGYYNDLKNESLVNIYIK